MKVAIIIICLVELVELILIWILFKDDMTLHSTMVKQFDINDSIYDTLQNQTSINASLGEACRKNERQLYKHTRDINFLKTKTNDKYTKGTLDD